MAGSGRRGAKRGASQAFSSEGSRNQKRRGGGSGTSSSASGGVVRGEGGPEQKKEARARHETWKRSEARQQFCLKDVKKVQWRLKTNSSGNVIFDIDDFKKMLRCRRRLFKRVMSLDVNGIPVTQPSNSEKETYHIVEVIIDAVAEFQHLFRNSDCYLLAFRRVRNENNPTAWEGWFHFNDPDINLPLFFGERISVGWDCGYQGPASLSISKRTISELVACMMGYTQANCTRKSYGTINRVAMLHTWMVFLGECQRSAVFLEFVQQQHDSVEAVTLGPEREEHIHGWSNICYYVLNLYHALLMRRYAERDWEEVLAAAENDMINAATELLDKGIINRFMVYHVNPDGTPTDRLNAQESLLRLVGSESGQLLHLINYDDENVLKIHKLMKKHNEEWPDSGTDPDTPEPQPKHAEAVKGDKHAGPPEPKHEVVEVDKDEGPEPEHADVVEEVDEGPVAQG